MKNWKMHLVGHKEGKITNMLLLFMLMVNGKKITN